MPTIFVEIPDHAHTIRRASMMSIIVNVLGQLGLEDDYLQFNDGYDNKTQPGTQLGEFNDVKFGNETRISVDMEEQRDTFNLVDRGIGYKFELPILHDPEIGLRVTPAHARHNVTARLSGRFRSRGYASEWINEMHRRTAMFGDVFETEATYSYVIPNEALVVAKAMYLVGSKKVEPKETLEEYLNRVLHDNVTIATTSTGTSDCRMMRATYGRINVIMESLGEIREEKDDTTGACTAEITYRYSIAWPEAVKIDYPCMVNNTLIPECLWHINELPYTVNIESYQKDDFVNAQDKLTTHHEHIPLPVVLPPVGMPTFMTEHRAPTEIEILACFLVFGEDLPTGTAPEELAESEPKLLCNLADLGEVELTKETLEYIRASYSSDPTGRDSLFKIYTYAFRRPLNNRTIIDKDLNVWLMDTEISLTEEYRLVLTLDLSTVRLSDKGREHLKIHTLWLLKYIESFHQHICLDWPWLFPFYQPNNNIAGGGLYPVLTTGGDQRYQRYYPTTPEWNMPYYKPEWPKDYTDWWESDNIITDPAVINPDGSVDIDLDPNWPGWDGIIDDIGDIDVPSGIRNVHQNTIIAKRANV